MYRFLFFILLTLFCIGNGFAQTRPATTSTNRDISGTIVEISEDNQTETTLPGANICLLNAADSTVVKGLSADNNGNFLIPGVKPGNYILATSFISFNTSFIDIPAERFRESKNIDLGKITLEMAPINLADVIIKGQSPEVVVKEDTLEYHADAFKMQEGAVVEDLLKRLPGIEVDSEGKITDASGKQVKRVFVNGKEFFDKDPKVATQNLTASMIDKVQVVEKQTDQAVLSGVDDGERETIINLTIKKNMMQGWMGNITAGLGAFVDNKYGEGLRYGAQGMLNRFKENGQVSFFVNANNINRQGFTDRGNTANEGTGISPSAGITNSNSFGVNASTIVNDKLKMGGSAQYKYSETFSDRTSFSTNMNNNVIQYQRSRSESNRNSHNIELNGKMEYKPDNMYTIVFEPKILLNMSHSRDTSFRTSYRHKEENPPSFIGDTINLSHGSGSLQSYGLDLSGELTISRRFERKGRRLSVRLTGDMSLSSTNGTNLSVTQILQNANKNRNLDQESETKYNSSAYNFRISHVEPLRENMTLQMYYTFRYNVTQNIKETIDFVEYVEGTPLLIPRLNTNYSRSLANDFINQTIGISLNAVNPKYTYNFGVNINPSYTQSTSFIKDGNFEDKDSILNKIEGRKVINYSPNVNFTYRFKPQTTVRFTYRGSMRQPVVTYLDPTLNTQNPLIYTGGNPNLLPSFVNFLSLQFNNFIREKQQSLTANIDYSFTRNEMVWITYFDYDPDNPEDMSQKTGIQLRLPENEKKGSWNTSGNVLYSFPIGANKRFKFNTNARVTHSNRVGYTNVKKVSVKNIAKTSTAYENISLSYTKDWFYGQLRANVRYSHSSFTLEGKPEQSNYKYTATYNTQLTLPWNFNFASDVNYSTQRGLSSGFNKDEVIWNISIIKQFMKGNRASVKIEWTDILQQRLNITQSVSTSSIVDSEYRAMTSYVMLSFSYRFNNLKGNPNVRQRQDMQNNQNMQQGGAQRTGAGMGQPGTGQRTGTGMGQPGTGQRTGTGMGQPGTGQRTGTGTGQPGTGQRTGTGTGQPGTGLRTDTGMGQPGIGQRTDTGMGQPGTEQRNAPPVMQSPTVAAAADSSELKEEQIRTRTKGSSNEYYQNLQSHGSRTAVLSPEIPNKDEVVAPQPAPKQPVPSGEYYKVQILMLKSYKDIAELHEKYRVDGVTVEKYSDGYYKYVVPAGTTVKEALTVLKQMTSRGIEGAWIAVYQNGERIRPSQALAK